MSNNISSFGIGAYLIASKTLPVGYYINSFSDDNDSLRFEHLTVNRCAVDLNAKMYSSFEANVINVSLSLIPNSPDDQLMRLLLNANHVSNYQDAVPDVLTLTIKYPDLSIITLRDGRIVSGPPGLGAQASGRYATNVYMMHFADISTLNMTSAVVRAIGELTKFIGQ